MAEEFSVNPSQLLEAASEFAHQPGAISEASAQEFLSRFPLPTIIKFSNLPETVKLEYCWTKYLKPDRVSWWLILSQPFILVGLGADSQKVKRLACIAISCLLENVDKRIAVQLVLEYDVYPLLLSSLVDGDEQVAAASTETIKKLAGCPEGMSIVFPANSNGTTHLGNLAARCSLLGRVRVLALIVKLFSISSSVASEISKSNLLSLLEAEARRTNDTLATLTALELLYELTEVQHSAEYLSRTTLFQLLSTIISNGAAESLMRSRAMMITGRLLSKENKFIDESCFVNVLSAIDRRFEFLDSKEADECECALEALGQIGSSLQGAALVLSNSPPTARHVVNAAFERQHHGKQLAALHSLANAVGETRQESSMVLNSNAEEALRRLIYEKAANTPKLTPSGLLLYMLQQDSEIRIAGYRLITAMAARPWCLMEIISRPEITNIVTDTTTESTKIGMEVRQRCCEAIYKTFTSSSKLISDPAFTNTAAKLQEAIRRGPYLTAEAQPVVMTADRF